MFTRFPRPLWSPYALGGLTVLLGGLLLAPLLRPPPALAQVPDSGAQRNEMIRELQASNRKLAEMVELLREIRDLSQEKTAARPRTTTRPTTPPTPRP